MSWNVEVTELNVRLGSFVLGSAMVVGALFGAAGGASADAPPNCSTADVAGVAAGVTAATSAYLFTHPDVNAFITDLKGESRDEQRAKLQAYLADNPQTAAEIRAIRQPMTDLRARCGFAAPDSDQLAS